MKKLMILMMTAALLLFAGCAGSMMPIIAPPSGAPTASATATTSTAASTEAAPTGTTPVPETTAAPASPTTEAPATVAAATEQTEPAEPVDPWSLMDKSMFEQGAYTDDLGNDYTYSYGLPCIKADTPAARAINRDIDETFGAHIREAEDAMDKGLSLGVVSVGYYGQVWEDVLTLVIIEHTDWAFDDYGVYCYEVSTGTWLSTPMLLEKMGVDSEDFLDICRQQFRQYFMDEYSEIPEDQRQAYGYYDGLNRVDTHRYVNLDLQTYPDVDGDLVVIAPIVSLAGADYYYHPIHLGLNGAN